MSTNHSANSYRDEAPRKTGVIENFVRKAIDPNYAVARQGDKIREAVTQVLIDAANVMDMSYVEISKHGEIKPNAVDDFLANGAHQEVDLKNGTISIRAFVRQPGLLMLTVCQPDKMTPQEEQHPFSRNNNEFDMRHLLDVPPTQGNASMYCNAGIVSHDATRPLSLTVLDILRIFSHENNLTLLTELNVTNTVTYVFIDKA